MHLRIEEDVAVIENIPRLLKKYYTVSMWSKTFVADTATNRLQKQETRCNAGSLLPLD